MAIHTLFAIMKFTKNTLNIAALLKIKGIGNAWIMKHFQVDSSEAEIIERLAQKYQNAESLFYECKIAVENEFDSLENYADGIIAFCDDGFPAYSAKIKDSDKPILLTYKGDLGLLNKDLLRIAVIGFLNPCDKIKELEEKILDSMQDVVIVSGLAKGCDEIAHRFALKKGKATIAILPSTLRNILPSANRELAQEIALNGGLLISEYITECDNPRFDLPQRYIERDRLQALFSDAVCLVASFSSIDSKKDKNKDSGARHALGKAKEWGIARIAPRGSENDERFNLNREILCDKESPAIEINAGNIKGILERIRQSKMRSLC